MRVKRQDTAAWQLLANLYGPLIYSWARRSGLQDSDAADVFQDVFQSLLLNVATFRREQPGDSFRGWLWTITKNRIRDFYRSHAKRELTGGTAARVIIEDAAGAPEDFQLPDIDSPDSVKADRAAIYRKALELIQHEYLAHTWQAFLRVTVNGDAPADVADDLGMSVWSVYQAKSRILRRLRREFSELGDF